MDSTAMVYEGWSFPHRFVSCSSCGSAATVDQLDANRGSCDQCAKEWLRHDSPEWDQVPLSDASDAVMALRSARVETRGYGSVRTYRMPAATPGRLF